MALPMQRPNLLGRSAMMDRPMGPGGQVNTMPMRPQLPTQAASQAQQQMMMRPQVMPQVMPQRPEMMPQVMPQVMPQIPSGSSGSRPLNPMQGIVGSGLAPLNPQVMPPQSDPMRQFMGSPQGQQLDQQLQTLRGQLFSQPEYQQLQGLGQQIGPGMPTPEQQQQMQQLQQQLQSSPIYSQMQGLNQQQQAAYNNYLGAANPGSLPPQPQVMPQVQAPAMGGAAVAQLQGLGSVAPPIQGIGQSLQGFNQLQGMNQASPPTPAQTPMQPSTQNQAQPQQAPGMMQQGIGSLASANPSTPAQGSSGVM